VKRVLLDENIPRTLARDLQEFEVRTVQEEGWSGLTNGALLRSASAAFDVLVTGDKRLEHQQNIAAAGIAVVVVAARSTRVADIRALLDPLTRAIRDAKPGTVTRVAAV
jgi:hypothetical protein